MTYYRYERILKERRKLLLKMRSQNQMFNSSTLNVFSNIITVNNTTYLESRIYSGLFSLAKSVLDDCQMEILPRTEVDALILENSFNVIFLRLRNCDKNIKHINIFCQPNGVLRRIIDIAYQYRYENFDINEVVSKGIEGVSFATSSRIITSLVDLLSGLYGNAALGFYVIEEDDISDIKLYFADLDSSKPNKFREVKNLRFDTKKIIKSKLYSVTEEEDKDDKCLQ